MSDSDNTQDGKAMSPASAGSHGDKCQCGLVTRLVGDGCEHCNPAMMIEILREQIADMRLTDDERKAIRRAAAVAGAIHDYRMKAALGNLLGRLG